MHHVKLPTGIDAMPQDVFAPLLILSIYDPEALVKHIGRTTPLVFEGSLNRQYHWDIDGAPQFSLVFFLVGGHVDYKTMLNQYFPGVFNIAASPFLMNYFGSEDKVVIRDDQVMEVNDLGLLIGYTSKVLPRPPRGSLVGPEKSREFVRTEHLLGLSLLASDDKIGHLV